MNYANWHTGLYVVVPNMPAWSCDVCALCQIDLEVLQHLLPLIGPVTQPSFARAHGATDLRTSVNDLLYDDSDPGRHPA